MLSKRIILTIVLIIILLGSIVAGLLLLKQSQELRKEASTPYGQATVSLTPEQKTLAVGETINITLLFNTAGYPVSTVTTKLTFPFTGTASQISVEDIQIDAQLLETGNWSCPIKESYEQDSEVNIDISCLNVSTVGFISTEDVSFATITFKVNSLPSTNPTVIAFAPQESIITNKTDGMDILLAPTSFGTYTVSSSEGDSSALTVTLTPTTAAAPSATATVTPTTSVGQGGTSSTPTPTTRPTSSPTPTTASSLTNTPTPTASAVGSSDTLPDSGVPLPTLAILLIGFIVMVTAAVAAL